MATPGRAWRGVPNLVVAVHRVQRSGHWRRPPPQLRCRQGLDSGDPQSIPAMAAVRTMYAPVARLVERRQGWQVDDRQLAAATPSGRRPGAAPLVAVMALMGGWRRHC